MHRKNSASLCARRHNGDGAFPVVLRGRSEIAARQLREVMEAASSSEPSLIIAEEGLEPGRVARLIHGCQSAYPFVPIDRGAERVVDLHERLFGTDEHAGHARDLEVVRNGGVLGIRDPATILLQQIEELPAALQRRLARLLRDGELYIGDARRPTGLRARIVACARPDIDAEVAAGRFRGDLFRRLAGRRIQLAPLRERPEDVPDVVAAITRELAAESGVRPRAFTPAALTALASLPWPGNVDEIREVIARLYAQAPGTPARQEDVLRQVGFGSRGVPAAPFQNLREARHRFEREYIAAVLARHDWRIAEAAGTLGIERANLYRKIRQLGLSRPAGRQAGDL